MQVVVTVVVVLTRQAIGQYLDVDGQLVREGPLSAARPADEDPARGTQDEGPGATPTHRVVSQSGSEIAGSSDCCISSVSGGGSPSGISPGSVAGVLQSANRPAVWP